jgi:CSLREA domain-containing protein
MSTPSTHQAGKRLAPLLLAVLLAAGALSFAPPPRAAAMTYTVNTPADGPPVDDGFDCTLREAIIAANGVSNDCGQSSPNPDVIQFNFAGTITLIADLPAVNDTLTITGGGVITIDGASLYRIFTVNGGKTLTLDGLTLRRAFAESEGGAIRSFGSLYVNNSKFVNNHANAGGGAIYAFGVTDINSSQFLSNTAQIGGAILNHGILGLTDSLFQGNHADVQTRGGALWSSGPLIIAGGQFVDNQAGAGGAIYARRVVSATTLSITGATFEHNLGVNSYPDGNGGALLVDNLHATIQSSTFTRNGAQSGGAMYVGASGVLTLTHSTLRENAQTTNGAGLYNLGSAYLASVTLAANDASHGGGIDNFGLLFLTNVTLSGNKATYGGGLKNEGSGNARLSNVTLVGNAAAGGQGGGIMDADLSTHLNLTNVIVADSPTGGNCTLFPPPDSAQWSLSSDATCGFGLGRDSVSLKLNSLANNGGATQTHMPQLGSPAIDNGTDDDAPSIDQRGVMRPQGVFYDVGAVEVMPGEAPGLFYLPLIRR